MVTGATWNHVSELILGWLMVGPLGLCLSPILFPTEHQPLSKVDSSQGWKDAYSSKLPWAENHSFLTGNISYKWWIF